MTKYYKIEEQELLSLLSDSRKLIALEAAGVDNWDGYDYAMDFLSDQDKTTAEDLPSMYEELSTYGCSQCGNKIYLK
jgi:hypothetical protein